MHYILKLICQVDTKLKRFQMMENAQKPSRCIGYTSECVASILAYGENISFKPTYKIGLGYDWSKHH